MAVAGEAIKMAIGEYTPVDTGRINKFLYTQKNLTMEIKVIL